MSLQRVRLFVKKFAWVSLLLPLCSVSFAGIKSDLDSEVLIAEVNGESIPYKSFDLLYRVVSLGKGAMTRSQLLESSIETRLLSQYGETQLGKQLLMSNTSVGYPVEMMLKDEYLGVLRVAFHEQFSLHLQEVHGGALENLVNITDDLESSIPKHDGKLALDYSLTPALASLYKSVQVASTKTTSGNELTINLWELFQSQNIQGKINIRQSNVPFIKTQATIALSKDYFIAWLIDKKLLSQEDLDGVKRLVWDKQVKKKVLLHYGLNKDIHDDNPVLKAAYNDVTSKEVEDYYHRNKEHFAKILYVDARHIRVENEKTAREVQKSLLRGMPFKEAVVKYSIADDKNNAQPGSLGRIHDEDKKDWLHTVVFALKENAISRPFRSPQGDGKKVVWEIFFVDKKAMGYHSVNSETVRYIAGKEIALNNLKSQFKSLRQSLYDKADIRLNKALMKSKGSSQ